MRAKKSVPNKSVKAESFAEKTGCQTLPLRVLQVDDDPAILIVTTLLSDEHITVDTTATVDEASNYLN